MKRHASTECNDPKIIRKLTFAELPEQLQKQLNVLSRVAYNGLVADKMVFSYDELEAAFRDCGTLELDVNLLSLMNSFKGFTSAGEELNYQFLHLTIQEYLAARWAAFHLSAHKLLMFFSDHLNTKRFSMMLLFLAGISQLKFPSAQNLFQWKLYIKFPASRRTCDYFLFLAQLIYESDNHSLYHSLASALQGGKLSIAWYSLPPFDCLVLAHFLAWSDHPLELLDLRDCSLTSHCLGIMHKVLSHHCGTTLIEEVDFSQNHLEPTTTLSFISKIPVFERTKKLTLRGLHCSEGVSPYHIEVHCLPHLTTLDISVKNIPDSSRVGYSLSLATLVTALRNYNLQVLRFQSGSIDGQNAVHLFRSLEHNTRLEELDLSGNSQLAEGDSEAVGCVIERMLKVNTLKELNLNGCQVTEAIGKHIAIGLAKNRSLVTLDLCSSCLSPRCAVSILQQLTTHPTLSSIEVGVLGVGNMKMKSKTTTSSIQCDISDTTSENCVEFFRALSNSELKYSKLIVRSLTDQTAEHFAVGLADSRSIQLLDLAYNQIGSAGAVNIFRSLEHHISMEELYLSRNTQLAEGDSEAVGCAIERMLRLNTRLKVLHLSYCNLTDAICKHTSIGLTKNRSLVTLELRSSCLSPRCSVSILQQITTHPTLSSIEVGVLGVGNVKMDRKTVPSCIQCEVSDATTVNCLEFFRALNYSAMKYSRLIVHSLTSQRAEHFAVGLADSKSVQVLDFSNNIVGSAGAVSIFRSLEHHTSLEELDLSGNTQLTLGDSEAVGCAIERMLRVNTRLKVLNLGYCRLGSAVATHIAAGLGHNTSLEELDLSGNILLTWGDSEAVGCAIERMLRVNTRLKVLNLRSCGLDTAVATHIAAGLEHNTSLEQLNLSGNSQLAEGDSEAGAVSIFRSLERNTSLEELDLSGNSLLAAGDSEAVGCAIERMLGVNARLRTLKLRDCNLNTAVATHIAAGLAQSSLAELDIAGNHLITSDGWMQIFKHLHNNSFLKKLDISKNHGLESSSALAEMLSCNKSLTELDIGYCGIPEAGLTEIARRILVLQSTSLRTLNCKIDDVPYTIPPHRKTFISAKIETLKISGNYHIPD